MTLTLKQQAALNVAKKFTIALALVFAFTAAWFLVPTDILLQVISLSLMVFCIYNLYKIEVLSLESKQFDKK